MKKEDQLFDVLENESEQSDVVELLDENGDKTLFNIIATLIVDEQEYAILSNTDDEDEVLIFRVTEENEEFVFETIEDEDEMNAVIDAYNELLEEEDEN